MRVRLICLVLLVFWINTSSAATCPPTPDSDGDGIGDSCDRCDGRLNGGRIVIGTSASADLSSAVSGELVRWLRDMTGTTFTVERADAIEAGCRAERTAIFLVTENDPVLPGLAPPQVFDLRNQLATAGIDAFALYAEPGRGMWIVARRERGLIHGFYAFLEGLGARWFFPGDNWTLIPTRTDLRLTVSTVENPDLVYFNFTAGGFGSNAAFPPADYHLFQDRILAWMRRIRFPQDSQRSCGHTAVAFTSDQQNAIRADPLQLAEVGGVRQLLPNPTSGVNAKLHNTHHATVPCSQAGAVVSYVDSSGQSWCEDPNDYTSRRGVVGLFTDWVLTRLMDEINAGRPRQFISVEPGDSLNYGHCDCWKCRALLRKGPYGPLSIADSRISDRVFHMANVAATHVGAALPDHGVCLYGYNAHAAPPTIPLKPNLYVAVDAHAYHFRFTGMTAEELLDAWVAKQSANPFGRFQLGIRDGWATGQDQPVWSVQRTLDRFREWIPRGYVGATVEATYGAGAVGLPLYVASRLAWDSGADVEAIVADFHQRAFGLAAEPMRRMTDRWARGYLMTSHELGLSYADLADATARLAGVADPGFQRRVHDYKLYVHYLRLLYEYRYALTNNADDDYLRHIWRIFHSGMVFTRGLQEAIDQNLPPDVAARWDLHNANAGGWATLTPISAQELTGWMQDGAARYPPLAGAGPIAFSETLRPWKKEGIAHTTVQSQTYTRDHRFAFYSTGAGNITFDFVNASAPGHPPMRVTVRDRLGATVRTLSVPSSTLPIVLIGLASGVEYFVEVDGFDPSVDRYYFRTPSELAFAQVGPFDPSSQTRSQRQYFFVPQGTTRVFLYASTDGLHLPTFFTPQDGYQSAVAYASCPTCGPNVFAVDVPAAAGRIWAVSGVITDGGDRARFLNVPTVLAASPDQVLVPAELLP